MDAIILVGGQGNRMESVLPKPLVEVRGKTILAHQLDYLMGTKLIDRIILAMGYKAEEIIAYLKLYYQDASLEFSVEHEPLGTGGAIKKAMKLAKSDLVLVLNCDDITDIDLTILSRTSDNTICIAHPRLPFGLIREKEGYAIFEEKPLLPDWVSCGWYLFKKDDLLKTLPDNGSLEYDVFPKMKLKLHKHEGFWQPLNTKKDLIEFENLK